MNPDILLQIQQPPPPKNDLDAFRHKKETAATRQQNESDSAQGASREVDRYAEETETSDDETLDFAAFMASLRAESADSRSPAFTTPQARAEPQPQQTLDDASALSDKLDALGLEIANILKDLQGQSTPTEDTENLETGDTDMPDGESLLSLLSSLLEQIENRSDTTGETDADALSGLLGELKTLLGEDEEELIAAGLTPEQITDLQNDLLAFLKEQSAQDDQDRLAALQAQIVPVTPDRTQQEQSASLQDTSGFSPEHMKSDRYEMRYQADTQTGDGDTPDRQGESRHALHAAQGQNAAENAASANKNAPAQGNTALPAWMAFSGEEFSLDGLDDGLSLQQGALSSGNLAQSLQSGLTGLVTQAPAAGQAHPAVQMVAATIQKAVKAGEDTNIKLQLDPPELGRVEVKMSFGKDGPAKIVLTAEKPETYMMLQRDSHALQQALQDAGLDTDGGSLSFELAQDNHDFGDGNRRGGGHDSGGTGASSDAGEQDLIETTIAWRTDPETGLTRYNILA